MTAANNDMMEYNNQQSNDNDENDMLFQSLLYETARVGHITNINTNDQGIIDCTTDLIEEYEDDENDHYVDLGDVEFAHKMITSDPIPKFNCMNIMNFISYIWNLSVAIIVGYYGLFGLLYTSYEVAYGQYQSIITPWVYTCYIWIPIFILDGIYSLLQLLHPNYRGSNDSIGIMFFYSNIAQSLLIITYSFEYFFLSFILNIYLLVFLNNIFIQQLPSPTSSQFRLLIDWIVLQLPFQLKYAWILYCTCIVLVQSLVAHSESISTQFTACILCFVILTSFSISFLMPYYTIFGTTTTSSSNNHTILQCKPNYTIPIVIVWSFIGTFIELHNPKDTIKTLFGEDIMDALKFSTIGCCIVILCFGIIRISLFYWIRRNL